MAQVVKARLKRAIADLVQQAIDLHVHIGPEVIPRAYTAATLAASQQGKLAGAVVKNHFYPTAFGAVQADAADFRIIPGLVLNRFVGGLNPDAVWATSLIANGPFVVWLPTVHAERFLRANTYEIAPEWVADAAITCRKSSSINPVRITSDGKLLPAARRVIQAIAQADAVLATGHIAWQETELVAHYAQQCGVRAVIVTHPIYQHIAMPIHVQQQLAAAGCYMEQCASMYRMDGILLDAIVGQIRAIGSQHVILSSDVGQSFSPSPSDALREYCLELASRSITLAELQIMLVDNPRKILGLPAKMS